MSTILENYESLGIDKDVYEFGCKITESLKDRFAQIDETAEYNQLKVLAAMQKAQVSEACLLGTTGYGYNDLGRDTLEEVYANVFHTEDNSIIRCFHISGPSRSRSMTEEKILRRWL